MEPCGIDIMLLLTPIQPSHLRPKGSYTPHSRSEWFGGFSLFTWQNHVYQDLCSLINQKFKIIKKTQPKKVTAVYLHG